MGFRRGGTEKTHSPDGSKTLSQLTREHDAWREAQPMIVRCGVDGCGQTHEGTVASGKEWAAEHRATDHPELAGPRTRRQVEDEQRREKRVAAEAAAVADQERRRQERALQAMDEGLPQEPALPEREPSRTDRPGNDGGHRPNIAAAVTRVPAPRSDSAGHRSHGLRWTREKAIAAVRAAAEELGHPPSNRDYDERRDLPLPSTPTATKLFGSWAQMIEAAGFERPTRATRYSGRAVVGDPAITSSAEAVASTGDGSGLNRPPEVAPLLVRPPRPDVALSIEKVVELRESLDVLRTALLTTSQGVAALVRALDEHEEQAA